MWLHALEIPLVFIFLCVASSTKINREGSSRRGVYEALPVLHSKVTITAGENLADGCKSLFHKAITAALTFVLLPTKSDAKYFNESPLRPVDAILKDRYVHAVGVFSPGYKIDAEQYRYLVDPFPKLMTVQAAGDADSSMDSLRNDANFCLAEEKRLYALDASSRVKEKEVSSFLFIGHSRGGAVAALAAAMHLNSTTVRSGEILSSAPVKALLVLLDPVDSAEGFVLDELKKTMRTVDSHETGQIVENQNSKNARISDSSSGNSLSSESSLGIDLETSIGMWPWPVLIVSTPFGGQSAYYKVPYESSCSPASRNGDVFARTLRGLAATPAAELSLSSDRLLSKGHSRIVHVRLPDVGHTQLLQNRKNSTVGSVCVANEKVSDDDVKGMISVLTQSWVSIFNVAWKETDEMTGEVERLKDMISAIYPKIRTEWFF